MMEYVAIVGFLRVCRRRSAERRERLRKMERKQRLLDFRRRKENLNVLFLLFLCSVNLGATARFDRLIWEKTQSCDWWDRVVLSTFTAQDWYFRMSNRGVHRVVLRVLQHPHPDSGAPAPYTDSEKLK